MKRILLFIVLAAVCGWGVTASAQSPKPKLKRMTIWLKSIPDSVVTCTGNNELYATLIFDKPMLQTPANVPAIKFGQTDPNELTLPISESKWFDDTTCVVFFVVSPLLPQTDGIYKFLISGSSSQEGQTMDPTVSTEIKNERGQVSILAIYRSGILTPDVTKLDFSTILAGTFRSKTVIFTNTSCANVKIESTVISEPFVVLDQIAGQTLKPEATLTVRVQFRPPARNIFNGTLKINYPGGKFIEIQLAGAARGAQIVLDPVSVNFDSTVVGGTAMQTVKVKNESAPKKELSDTLVVSDISTNSTIFQVPPTSLKLAPDSSQTIAITFKPPVDQAQTKVDYTGSVIFTNNDSTQSERSLTVNGRGYKKEPPPAFPSFTYTWPNGRTGYINTSEMTICLPLSPADASKIQEVRWKFTPTAGDTPTAAIDTTKLGGGRKLEFRGGSYCFSIPLAAKLAAYSSVRLYFYLWFEGINGVSGYNNRNLRFFSEINYDIAAPAFKDAPAVQGWAGSEPGYTNADNIKVCWTTQNDLSGIREVRWKFTTSSTDAPKDSNDFGGAKGGKFLLPNGVSCATIPLKGRITENLRNERWYCYVWLVDNIGNSGYKNAAQFNFFYVDTPSFKVNPAVQDWSGKVDGYTNADTIRVCWTNSTDLSGIREVRWKFTTSSADAPKDSNDFGGAKGGKFLLPSGESCAKILLKGKITENKKNERWYCYMWLVDNVGNSGHKNAARFNFVYDVTAPSKAKRPFIINIAGVPWSEQRWFGRPLERALTLTLVLPDSATDAREVFWSYKRGAVPGSSTFLSRPDPSKPNTVKFDIPFNSTALCGDDSLRFWFKDMAGNVEPKNFASVRYRFDICAPEIKRTSRPDAVALKQTAFADNITISDHYAVDSNSVMIYYRFGGTRRDEDLALSAKQRAFFKTRRTKSGDTLWARLQFPAQALTISGLEYRVVARDSLNNSVDYGEWLPVRVRISGDGESRIDETGDPVAQTNGTDSSAYRLISIPFWLDKPKPKDVLEDDLGPDNKRTKWRLIEYRPDLKNPFVDYDRQDVTIANFIPGRAFFIIVRDSNKVIDSGGGVTVSTVKDTTITLKEGWNLFGNPFNFPIALDNLEIKNSRLIRQFFALDRKWNPHFDAIEPWEGYAVKVVRDNPAIPITLRIPPVSAKSGFSKARAGVKEAAGEWTLQIAAKAGAAVDDINWVGARRTAAEEYDEFDLVEPPVIGNYVSVSIPNMNWSDLAMEYTADFRPLGRDLYEWPLKVASNYSNGEVVLEFNGVAKLPAGYETYLVDEAYGVARNLRHNPVYRFVTGANGIEKSLKLLVGKPETLQKHSNGIALVPKAFELSQNFPNPFAAKYQQSFTAIRYTLPKSANVTVEVYNMLGQKVRTLVAGQVQAADYYMATWDGRDEAGKEVSSGVYVYRLLAESEGGRFTATRKLLLVK
jgi:hypothetical protein